MPNTVTVKNLRIIKKLLSAIAHYDEAKVEYEKQLELETQGIRLKYLDKLQKVSLSLIPCVILLSLISFFIRNWCYG